MEKIWQQALEKITHDEIAVLVAVVESTGSVPGKRGAKMVVTAEECIGTVGGGFAEQTLSAEARQGGGARLKIVSHDGAQIASACSGRQRVAVFPLLPEHCDPLRAVIRTIQKGRFGTLTITNDTLSFAPDVKAAAPFRCEGDAWSYSEIVGYQKTLTIIGGGHVSLALCRTMSPLPFYLRVLDDRAEVRTLRENRFAHERLTVSYDSIVPHLPTGEGSFAAIMTHAHAADEIVLAQLVPLSFAYLGMMGSATKVETMFERLKSRGISSSDLAKVHAPIGLPIGSKTPEEIALSIAAEIVKVGNSF